MSNENKEKDNYRGNSGFLSGSHEDVVEQGKREVEAGFMPQINPISVNLADYDVIAIGTPTWWYTMAPAVLTFLTTNDFTGKTVIPFMTNGGWPGHVIKDMKDKCKGAAFAHEMQIQFDSMGKDHLETSEDVITEYETRFMELGQPIYQLCAKPCRHK